MLQETEEYKRHFREARRQNAQLKGQNLIAWGFCTWATPNQWTMIKKMAESKPRPQFDCEYVAGLEKSASLIELEWFCSEIWDKISGSKADQDLFQKTCRPLWFYQAKYFVHLMVKILIKSISVSACSTEKWEKLNCGVCPTKNCFLRSNDTFPLSQLIYYYVLKPCDIFLYWTMHNMM